MPTIHRSLFACSVALTLVACGSDDPGGSGGAGGAGGEGGSLGGAGGVVTTGGSAGEGGSDTAMPPTAPASLGLMIMAPGIHVSWADSSDDEDEFAIERKDSTGDFVEIATVPFDTTQYHDAPLDAETYTYRVAARNAAGEAWSTEETLTKP